jgi:hypothetical protein
MRPLYGIPIVNGVVVTITVDQAQLAAWERHALRSVAKPHTLAVKREATAKMLMCHTIRTMTKGQAFTMLPGELADLFSSILAAIEKLPPDALPRW